MCWYADSRGGHGIPPVAGPAGDLPRDSVVATEPLARASTAKWPASDATFDAPEVTRWTGRGRTGWRPSVGAANPAGTAGIRRSTSRSICSAERESFCSGHDMAGTGAAPLPAGRTGTKFLPYERWRHVYARLEMFAHESRSSTAAGDLHSGVPRIALHDALRLPWSVMPSKTRRVGCRLRPRVRRTRHQRQRTEAGRRGDVRRPDAVDLLQKAIAEGGRIASRVFPALPYSPHHEERLSVSGTVRGSAELRPAARQLHAGMAEGGQQHHICQLADPHAAVRDRCAAVGAEVVAELAKHTTARW